MLVLILAAPACSVKRPATASRPSYPHQDVIREIKDLEKTLGFQATENFLNYSEATPAYYRCYYTGKLELPASYEQLQLVEGDAAGCSLDENQYDIFFYSIEAVATGTAPVTPSLAQAPPLPLLSSQLAFSLKAAGICCFICCIICCFIVRVWWWILRICNVFF